jgi:hypothetical protein
MYLAFHTPVISSEADKDVHVAERCPSCSTPITQSHKILGGAQVCPKCLTKLETAFMATRGSEERRKIHKLNRAVPVAYKVKAEKTVKHQAVALLNDFVLGYFSARQVEGLKGGMSVQVRDAIKMYSCKPEGFTLKRANKKERSAFQAPKRTLDLVLACCTAMVEHAADYHANFVPEKETTDSEEPHMAQRPLKRLKGADRFTVDSTTPMLTNHSIKVGPADIPRFVNVDAILTAIVSIVLVGPGRRFTGDSEIGQDCRQFLIEVLKVPIKRAERSKMTTQREISQRGTHASEDRNLYMRMCRKFRDIISEVVKREFSGFCGLSSVFSMPWAPIVRHVDATAVNFVATTEDPTAFAKYDFVGCRHRGTVCAKPVFAASNGFELYTEFKAASLFKWTPRETGTTFPIIIGALGRIDKHSDNAFASSDLGVACGCKVSAEGFSEFTPHFFWYLYLLFIPCSARSQMADNSFAAAFLCIATWVIVKPKHRTLLQDTKHDKGDTKPKKTRRTGTSSTLSKFFPDPSTPGHYCVFWEQLLHLDWVVSSIVSVIRFEQRFVRKNVNLVLDSIMQTYTGAYGEAEADAVARRFPMFSALT